MLAFQNRGVKYKVFPYLLLLPSFSIAFVVLLYPLLNGIRLSFTEYTLFNPKYDWIGFRHYFQLFKDPVYWEIFKNSFVIILPAVAAQLLLGLSTALLFNRNFPFKGLFRSAIFIIWIIPEMVVALLWMVMFNSEFGILNYLLQLIGLTRENLTWLANPGLAKLAIIIVYSWRGVPFFMVMIIAALQTIPKDMVEASKIDGAGAFRRFYSITIPYILGVLTLCCLLSIVRLFQDITQIFILTGGGPLYSTTTFAVYVYQNAFVNFDMGRASAIGITWMLLLGVIAVFYVRIVSKKHIRD